MEGERRVTEPAQGQAPPWNLVEASTSAPPKAQQVDFD
jgi:hypothetical protein